MTPEGVARGAGKVSANAATDALGLEPGTVIDYSKLVPDQIKKLPQFTRMVGNGVPDDIAQSIIKATPKGIGNPLDPVMDIKGTVMKAGDPGFADAVKSLDADANSLFSAPGQLNASKLKGFMESAGPYVGIAIMGLKMAGLDDLGEQNRIGGLMRDALMTFGGHPGMMIAGAMTALPFVASGLDKTVITGLEKTLGTIFGALSLGGSNLAGTTVDSTIINPSEFNPAIMEELLLEVDQNPDFLGLGRPITREQIMNGEVAVPDSFLGDMATGHNMTLDEARGNSERLAKGEGGIDVGYTRHNLGAGGGTMSPDELNKINTGLSGVGITDPGQVSKVRAKIKTRAQLRAFQSNPKGWLSANGFTGSQGAFVT